MIDVKGIMEGKVEMKSITYEDLLNDAVERGSKEGIKFLDEQQAKVITRKKKDGTTYEAQKPLSAYRAEYLKTYAGYETKTKIKNAQKSKDSREKRIKRNSELAAAALAKLKK